MNDRADRIEWTYTPRTSQLLRVLVFVPIGVLGGVFLLGLVLPGWLVIDTLVRGDFEQVAVVAVGTVLAGLFALRGPPAVLFLPDERQRLASEFDVSLRPRYLVVASVVGAAVLFVAFRIEPGAGFVVFLGGMATMVVVSVLRSKGEIDSEDLTLEYDFRDVSLSALRNVRAVTIGSLAICWLSFERGGGGARAPRFVALPADTYRRARPVFERAIAASAETGRTAPLAERVIFLVFGVGLLGVGPVLWILTASDSDATIFVLYAGALMSVFGLLFVWFAAVN